ncbi:NAD(P)-binding protein [Cadophora sp. DSE1049]|nr:NAD(P)-binding protein [Cadophora sp. DSE1049]
MSKVAFITGANGISGGAILEYLVSHTTEQEWRKIIVTSRSPFQTRVQDSRVQFIALDFTKSPTELVPLMNELCKETTHAYFTSYVHDDDFKNLAIANTSLFSNFLTALATVAPGLENVTLQTGGKNYGVHLQPVPTPARETDPRHAQNEGNFYHVQEDFLIAQQKLGSWTWNVIRPQAIIGATQKPNGMNLALTIALYFLICKELGVEAIMPTNQIFWEGLDDLSYAPIIADLTIFVSTRAECSNEAFNVSNGDVFRWKEMWPKVAKYFGAKASSDPVFKKPVPVIGTVQQEISLVDWHQDKEQVWFDICTRMGVPQAKLTFSYGTWQFQDWVFRRSWNVTLSIDKARKFGWTAKIDDYDCLVECFKQFEADGLIPSTKA